MKKTIAYISSIVATTFVVMAFVIATPAHASTQNYTWSPWIPTNYTYQYSGKPSFDYEAYIKQLIALLNQLQAQYDAQYGHNNTNNGNHYGNADVDVTTDSAEEIDSDEATLRGSVDFNNSDYAYVWFEYGQNSNSLSDDTTHFRLDDNDDEDFSQRITDLDRDEKYFFRAVAEDEDGGVTYGSVRSFTTDDSGSNNDDDDDNDNNDDEPEVETGDVRNITDDSARIAGSVDMNDFDSGIAFFVYGEDENQIDDTDSDYDTYSDIDTDGLDFEKVKVDSDADGTTSYTADFWGLNDDTEYFYRMCVQYEDEDGDDVLSCGSTESFETDN